MVLILLKRLRSVNVLDVRLNSTFGSPEVEPLMTYSHRRKTNTCIRIVNDSYYRFEWVMSSILLKRLRSVNELGARLNSNLGGPEVEPLMTIQSPGKN